MGKPITALGTFASEAISNNRQASRVSRPPKLWSMSSATAFPSEAISCAIALSRVLLIWLISGSIIIGVIAAILFYLLPGIFPAAKHIPPPAEISEPAVDVLVLIRGAVQAGFSLLQSMDVIVREMPAPAGEEFARVQREVQLGIPLGQSLENLSDRMESDDLKMVVTAIVIKQPGWRQPVINVDSGNRDHPQPDCIAG